jgi:hypothetical protein
MRPLPAVLVLSTVLLAGCGDKKSNQPSSTNTASSQSSPLTAPVDYLGAIAKAKQTSEKTIDTASLNHAIDLFKTEQGRNPTSLEEMVTEKFIPRLPDAPYGMKIVYDASTGKVKVVPDSAAKK